MVNSEYLANLLSVENTVHVQFALDNAVEIITGFCHLELVPDELETTCYRMAIDLYNNEQFGADQGGSGMVSSLTEGDVNLSFGGSAGYTAYKDSLLKQYEKVLIPFRKVVF